MDNLKNSAFPLVNEEGGSYEDREVRYGFSKLEYAALMIAQGICAETVDRGHGYIAETAVKIAKLVLEEANK